jgi:HEAT repeat protein
MNRMRWPLLFFLLLGCTPQPTLEGRPLGYWVKALKARDPMDRARAAGAVSQLGIPQSALPDLIAIAKDDEYLAALEGVNALGSMGARAREAIPALLEIRKTHIEALHEAADSAIRKIDADAAEKAGIK